jgi:hypothetical protein
MAMLPCGLLTVPEANSDLLPAPSRINGSKMFGQM